MLMFVKKSNWKPIPEELKIWYGDNWIANTNGRAFILSMYGSNLEVDRHTTAGSKELKKITMEDSKAWPNYKNI